MGDAPEIIHATVNGASTSIPSGRRRLIGGWGETDDKPHAVRYVRADLYDALRAQVDAMLEAFAHAPAHVDFARMSAFTAAYDEWWEDHVEPALAKSTGSPDGQQ